MILIQGGAFENALCEMTTTEDNNVLVPLIMYPYVI